MHVGDNVEYHFPFWLSHPCMRAATFNIISLFGCLDRMAPKHTLVHIKQPEQDRNSGKDK